MTGFLLGNRWSVMSCNNDLFAFPFISMAVACLTGTFNNSSHFEQKNKNKK